MRATAVAGLAVVGLEQGRHAALGDDVGDLEPVIQHHADAQVAAWPLRILAAPAAPLGAIHIPDLHDLHGNVVADLALFGQGDQAFAGLAGMVFDGRLEDLVVQEVAVEAVGALQDQVAWSGLRW